MNRRHAGPFDKGAIKGRGIGVTEVSRDLGDGVVTLGQLGQRQVASHCLGVAQDAGVTGLFSEPALAAYRQRTGGPVEPGQVQGLADKLIAANLVARPGHGRYTVVDPFVREVWLARQTLLAR